MVDADPNLSFEVGKDIEADGFTVGTLETNNTARQIIKWAFNPSTEVGDVSPEIFEFQDKVDYYDNKYVLATLKSVVPEGLVSVNNVRDRMTNVVTNAKKADIIASKINSSDLAAIASQWGVKVDTARNVSLNAGFVQGVGLEAKVVGLASGMDVNKVSKPIVGTSGVFVVAPISRKPAGAPVNLPGMRGTNQQAARQNIMTKLVDAWKAKIKVEDSRSTYF